MTSDITGDFYILDDGYFDLYHRPEPVCAIQLKNRDRLVHDIDPDSHIAEDIARDYLEVRAYGG
jgi:hypothetical protein